MPGKKIGPYTEAQVLSFCAKIGALLADKGGGHKQGKVEGATFNFYGTTGSVLVQGPTPQATAVENRFQSFVAGTSVKATCTAGGVKPPTAGGVRPPIGGNTNNRPCPADTTVVSWGKHKGLTFGELIQKHKDYAEWTLRCEDPSIPMQEFQRYARAKLEVAGAQLAGTVAVSTSSNGQPKPSPLQQSTKRPAPSRPPPAKRRRAEGEAAVYDVYMFFDGSCYHNGQRPDNKAGFGVAVFGNENRLPDTPELRRLLLGRETNLLCTLAGPVSTTRSDPTFIGAERGTNNTGELTGLAEALLWLLEYVAGNFTDLLVLPGRLSALLLYDSKYAAEIANGAFAVTKNVELGNFAKYLLNTARGNPRLSVELEHVKGHSGTFGNEKADQLANIGCSTLKEPSATPLKFGRWAVGDESVTRDLFRNFGESFKYRVPPANFYCLCGDQAKADSKRGGVNAGKTVFVCAKQMCAAIECTQRLGKLNLPGSGGSAVASLSKFVRGSS